VLNNQATGYATQHIWCLSQTKTNWEGCGRQGIWHKNNGDGGGGGTNSPDWWHPARLSVHLPHPGRRGRRAVKRLLLLSLLLLLLLYVQNGVR